MVQCACGSANADEVPFHVFVHNVCAFSSLVRNPDVSEGKPGLLWSDSRVSVRTLDSLIADWNPPRIDFLSIDTEGTELDVLRGFTIERWYPKAVIAEVWPGRDDEITPYLEKFGYRLHERVGENNRYLR